MSGKLRPGDRAPSVELYRTSGSVIDIAELWSNAPVVITFLRHFG